MQKFVTMLFIIISSSLFAKLPTVDDSWNDILDNDDVQASFGQIFLDLGAQTGFGVFDYYKFCNIPGTETLQTIKKQEYCNESEFVNVGQGEQEVLCLDSELKYLTTSQHYTYQLCASSRSGGDRCAKWVTQKGYYALNKSIDVYELEIRNSERYGDEKRLLFPKAYNVPECQ